MSGAGLLFQEVFQAFYFCAKCAIAIIFSAMARHGAVRVFGVVDMNGEVHRRAVHCDIDVEAWIATAAHWMDKTHFPCAGMSLETIAGTT